MRATPTTSFWVSALFFCKPPFLGNSNTQRKKEIKIKTLYNVITWPKWEPLTTAFSTKPLLEKPKHKDRYAHFLYEMLHTNTWSTCLYNHESEWLSGIDLYRQCCTRMSGNTYYYCAQHSMPFILVIDTRTVCTPWMYRRVYAHSLHTVVLVYTT